LTHRTPRPSCGGARCQPQLTAPCIPALRSTLLRLACYAIDQVDPDSQRIRVTPETLWSVMVRRYS
jgi:hypothetical protein